MEAVDDLNLNPANEVAVRSVLLHDLTGRIQALLPERALLDLKKIKEQTGRDLVALKRDDYDQLIESKRLKRLDTQPNLFCATTLVDASLAHKPLVLHGEDGTVPVRLDTLGESLSDFNNDLLTMDIAVNEQQLATTTPDPQQDQDQIIQSLRSFTSLRIKQRLEDTLEIPTLPATAQRIIQLRVNPDAAISDLAEVVESDPSLAAQVVSWAASPYYATPGKIRSVQDAIVRVLGFDLVSNLALGLALGKTLEMPKDKADGITPYWLQSIYCSTLVESLVNAIPPEHKPSKGLVYLSGLLHNFGYLVLAHIFPPHFSQICRYIEANPHISHMAIEHHVLNITREQVCVWLMDLWNMPPEVCTALRYQHDPAYDGKHKAYPNLIFMALRLLRQHGIGDAPLEEIPAELYQRYKLDPQVVQERTLAVVEAKDEIEAIAKNWD